MCETNAEKVVRVRFTFLFCRDIIFSRSSGREELNIPQLRQRRNITCAKGKYHCCLRQQYHCTKCNITLIYKPEWRNRQTDEP